MAEHLKTLHDVQFRGGILMWKPEMFDMENAKDHFTWNSWHMSGVERKMMHPSVTLKFLSTAVRPPILTAFSSHSAHPWMNTATSTLVPTLPT